MEGETAGVDAQLRRLGTNIRRLRRHRELTLVQVAERAGLSHSFLSQVERGLARPSIPSLLRIAQVLGTSQIELMSGALSDRDAGPDRPASIVRSTARTQGLYGGEEAVRFASPEGAAFVPIGVRGSGRELAEYYEHDEDEFVLVLGGSLLLDLGADQGRHVLAPGDSAYITGGVPHRWCAAGDDGYDLVTVKQRVAPEGRPAARGAARPDTASVTISRAAAGS